jgi:glycosyltransferase involved in cell wall biosynthesis
VDLLPEVDYKEGYHHHLSGDINYVTYNPLSWLNFHVDGPKIGGIHSHCYWQPFAWQYGLLPNLANFTHMLTKRWELRRFDAIHIVNPIYPLNVENIYYIPDFVDSQVYSPCAPKNDDFTVGYASRKVWQKGHDIYLRLRELLEDIKFVSTGNILEINMPEFYSRNHVTLVPARVDTFGLVNVESMLCGTPVVSSGLPTHKALGLPIRYAYKMDQYVDEIGALRDLFESGAYGGISKECRESAMKYDKQNVVDQLENMFVEVANGWKGR